MLLQPVSKHCRNHTRTLKVQKQLEDNTDMHSVPTVLTSRVLQQRSTANAATEPALVALQATAELYDEEGFQRTGDVCEQQGPDTFMWIDRVSNIIKLSQGEYVSVSRLEALYAANSPSVHQMYLYGNSLRAYLVAIVVAQQGEIQATHDLYLTICRAA